LKTWRFSPNPTQLEDLKTPGGKYKNKYKPEALDQPEGKWASPGPRKS